MIGNKRRKNRSFKVRSFNWFSASAGQSEGTLHFQITQPMNQVLTIMNTRLLIISRSHLVSTAFGPGDVNSTVYSAIAAFNRCDRALTDTFS